MEAEDNIVGSHSGRPCPTCKVGTLERIRRKGLLALIPKSKNYQCARCRSKFLLLAGRYIFRIGKIPSIIQIVLTALIIIATIYFSWKLAIHLYLSTD